MNKISEQRKLFKDLEIGAEFRGAKFINNRGIAEYLILEKISKSKGRVLQSVPEQFAPRQIGGIYHFGANKLVWEFVSEPMSNLEFNIMLSQGK